MTDDSIVQLTRLPTHAIIIVKFIYGKLWAIIGDAYSYHDTHWIRNNAKKGIKLTKLALHLLYKPNMTEYTLQTRTNCITVEPGYNGHPLDSTYWLLYTGWPAYAVIL